jgi:hypothetical protein
MSKVHPVFEAFLKGRFSVLLVSLAALLMIGPLIPGDQTFVDKVFGVLMLVVLISCVRAVSQTRRFFWVMLIFTLINVGIGSLEIFSSVETRSFQVVVLVVRLSYFVLVFFSIMKYVLEDTPITGDKICGAVSAYMLMGITWSFVYSLFYLIDPGSIRVPEHLLSTETVNSTWTLYFSMTTLTTLGYGDITPIKPGPQSYAIMEAATGQMFLAVIIARLIAMHIAYDSKSPVKEDGDDG